MRLRTKLWLRLWAGRRPALAGVVAAGLILQLLSVAPAASAKAAGAAPDKTPPGQTAAAESAPAKGAKAADAERGAAVGQAKQTGKPVEVATETTETSITYANPDGTFTDELSAGPERIRMPGSDKWQTIDTTLVADASGVHPKATKAQLRFSRGGDKQAVRMTGGGKALDLGWDGAALPAPQLSGSIATYANVYPGADLQLEALPNGYSERVVLRTRPITQPVYRFPLGLTGTNARKLANGGLELTDKAGKALCDRRYPNHVGRRHQPCRRRTRQTGAGELANRRHTRVVW